MTTVTATRSELLARRSRERIAQRGHALLTQKRAALIGELRRAGREALREISSRLAEMPAEEGYPA